jgi:hypothetical protein
MQLWRKLDLQGRKTVNRPLTNGRVGTFRSPGAGFPAESAAQAMFPICSSVWFKSGKFDFTKPQRLCNSGGAKSTLYTSAL